MTKTFMLTLSNPNAVMQKLLNANPTKS